MSARRVVHLDPEAHAERMEALRGAMAAGETDPDALGERFALHPDVVRRHLRKNGHAPPAEPQPEGPRALPGVAKHARERCLQYHGLDLPDAEWLDLWLALLEGRGAVLLRRDTRGVGVYAVRTPSLPGGPLLLAYSPGWGTVVTVLPPEATVSRARRRPARKGVGKHVWGRPEREAAAVDFEEA